MTLATSFGAFGCFAIQGVLLARMLGVEQRGVFATAILFPQALLYLGLLGSPELYAGYATEGMDNSSLRRSAARYGLFSGVLSMLICIVLDILTIPEDTREVLPLAILCAATLPLQQIRLSVQAVDHGQRNFRRYNQVRLAAAAAFPIILCIGIALGYRDLQTACWMFFAAQLISLLLTQFGMNESWKGECNPPISKALREAKGLVGAWFSTELLEKLDLVLIMLLIATPETMGLYATAIPIASLMIIFPNAASLYFFNRGARQHERLSPRDAQRAIAAGIGLQCVSGAALAVCLPVLITLFYGEDFSGTVQFAWLLLPAGAFRGLLQACDSYLRARKKPFVGIWSRLLGVLILVLFSTLTLGSLGATAIPIGLSIAQFVCFVIVSIAVVLDTYRTNRPQIQKRPAVAS